MEFILAGEPHVTAASTSIATGNPNCGWGSGAACTQRVAKPAQELGCRATQLNCCLSREAQGKVKHNHCLHTTDAPAAAAHRARGPKSPNFAKIRAVDHYKCRRTVHTGRRLRVCCRGGVRMGCTNSKKKLLKDLHHKCTAIRSRVCCCR